MPTKGLQYLQYQLKVCWSNYIKKWCQRPSLSWSEKFRKFMFSFYCVLQHLLFCRYCCCFFLAAKDVIALALKVNNFYTKIIVSFSMFQNKTGKGQYRWSKFGKKIFNILLVIVLFERIFEKYWRIHILGNNLFWKQVMFNDF